MPDTRLAEVYKLVAQINEQLWLGHFDVWREEGLIMYRQGLMLNGAMATTGQCEALLRAGLEACERYFQAFQFVVWAGKDSRHALSSIMFRNRRPRLRFPARHLAVPRPARMAASFLPSEKLLRQPQAPRGRTQG